MRAWERFIVPIAVGSPPYAIDLPSGDQDRPFFGPPPISCRTGAPVASRSQMLSSELRATATTGSWLDKGTDWPAVAVDAPGLDSAGRAQLPASTAKTMRPTPKRWLTHMRASRPGARDGDGSGSDRSSGSSRVGR